jgi:DNA-binding LacI/PurR family transcriptional regulator
MPRPTIRTIAAAAKVSSCTVSRALRGDTHLSEKTRVRIQKLAREMGYEVNAYVSSWMAHVRSTKMDIPFQGCLAYLNYYQTALPLTVWDTPRRQLLGATDRARELGYRVEHLAVYRDALSSERIQQILYTRAIKGILLPVSGQLTSIDLPFESFACVSIGHHLSNPSLHYTSADHHMTMLKACTELSKLGYQRIGLLIDPETNERLELRPLSSYLGWQQQLPKSQQIPPLICKNEPSEDVLIKWCRRTRVDSILSFDGLRSCRHVLSKHFRIPEEIALATLDWHGADGNIAGIDQRHELIGAAAVDILTHMLTHNVYGIPETPRSTLVEGIWRSGATTPSRQ